MFRSLGFRAVSGLGFILPAVKVGVVNNIFPFRVPSILRPLTHVSKKCNIIFKAFLIKIGGKV